jgi:hypothetical protein
MPAIASRVVWSNHPASNGGHTRAAAAVSSMGSQ